MAVVEAIVELANVTAPMPETLVQRMEKVLPAGRPSSVAVPERYAVVIGYSRVLSEPAETTGAWFVPDAA